MYDCSVASEQKEKLAFKCVSLLIRRSRVRFQTVNCGAENNENAIKEEKASLITLPTRLMACRQPRALRIFSSIPAVQLVSKEW